MDNNNFNGGPVGSSNNDTGMAIIAYFIFFIPLIISQNRSTFLNFHINQSLILTIVNVVLYVASSIISMAYLSSIFGLFALIMVIIGIMNAAKGEMKPLPLIGNLFSIIK